MCGFNRVLVGSGSLGILLLLLSSCCGGSSGFLAVEQARVASLSERLERSDAEILELQKDVHVLGALLADERLLRIAAQPRGSSSAGPFVEGVVAGVDGRMCRIRVTSSLKGLDWERVAAKTAASWVVYNDDGFKAEAFLEWSDEAAGQVVCRILRHSPAVDVRVGDKVMVLQ